MALFHQTNILYSSIKRTVRRPRKLASETLGKPVQAVATKAAESIELSKHKLDNLASQLQIYTRPLFIKFPTKTN